MTVLEESEKFMQLWPDVMHDKTKAINLKFQKRFLKLVKNKNISVSMYEAIKLLGSVWP